MSSAEELHRRDFARHFLGTIGVTTLATSASFGEPPPPPALPEDATKDESPPFELLVLTQIVRSYPSEHYTGEALRGMYGDIAGDISRGKQLRSYPLKNGDEPACTFRVFRADAAPTKETR